MEWQKARIHQLNIRQMRTREYRKRSIVSNFCLNIRWIYTVVDYHQVGGFQHAPCFAQYCQFTPSIVFADDQSINQNSLNEGAPSHGIPSLNWIDWFIVWTFSVWAKLWGKELSPWKMTPFIENSLDRDEKGPRLDEKWPWLNKKAWTGWKGPNLTTTEKAKTIHLCTLF